LIMTARGQGYMFQRLQNRVEAQVASAH